MARLGARRAVRPPVQVQAARAERLRELVLEVLAAEVLRGANLLLAHLETILRRRLHRLHRVSIHVLCKIKGWNRKQLRPRQLIYLMMMRVAQATEFGDSVNEAGVPYRLIDQNSNSYGYTQHEQLTGERPDGKAVLPGNGKDLCEGKGVEACN
jgi:hypothetical protein